MTIHDHHDRPHLPPAGPGAWRHLDRAVALGFVGLLVVPGLVMALGLRPPAVENRPLYTPPPFAVGSLLETSWYAQWDQFLSDNLVLRPYAVRIRGTAIYETGGTGNPEVIRGAGSWLFSRGEFEPDCTQTAATLTAALDAAALRFDAAGIDLRIMVAPDKHAIYPDKLGEHHPFPPPCSDVERGALRAAIAARPGISVDAWAAVLARRESAPDGPPLYYRQDSHWTPTGAVVAIRDLVRSLDPSLWSDEDVVEVGTRNVAMDLARQIGLRRSEATIQLAVRPGVTQVREGVPVNADLSNARAVFRVTASGDRPVLDGRTLVLYDSYFGLNVARVAPFFAESVWVHVGDLGNYPELAAALGPFDRVILERSERGLYGTDVDALLAAAARAGRR